MTQIQIFTFKCVPTDTQAPVFTWKPVSVWHAYTDMIYHCSSWHKHLSQPTDLWFKSILSEIMFRRVGYYHWNINTSHMYKITLITWQEHDYSDVLHLPVIFSSSEQIDWISPNLTLYTHRSLNITQIQWTTTLRTSHLLFEYCK